MSTREEDTKFDFSKLKNNIPYRTEVLNKLDKESRIKVSSLLESWDNLHQKRVPLQTKLYSDKKLQSKDNELHEQQVSIRKKIEDLVSKVEEKKNTLENSDGTYDLDKIKHVISEDLPSTLGRSTNIRIYEVDGEYANSSGSPEVDSNKLVILGKIRRPFKDPASIYLATILDDGTFYLENKDYYSEGTRETLESIFKKHNLKSSED